MARNKMFSEENAITANKEELAKMTAFIKQGFLDSLAHKTDLHNPDDVRETIIKYFDECEAAGMRPGNMGMYRALGVSHQDISNALSGKSKSRVSTESIAVIKNAMLAISEYREQLGSSGKLNPVTLIFWQKNYDGLQDNARLEVVQGNTLEAQQTPEQIAAAIERDIPIDAIEGEYKEIEG